MDQATEAPTPQSSLHPTLRIPLQVMGSQRWGPRHCSGLSLAGPRERRPNHLALVYEQQPQVRHAEWRHGSCSITVHVVQGFYWDRAPNPLSFPGNASGSPQPAWRRCVCLDLTPNKANEN